MGDPRFIELIEEEKKVHQAKNKDYTGDRDSLYNLRQCEKFGVPAYVGVLVRLTDKYAREESLALRAPAVKSESFLDIQLDKSVYSKLVTILYEEFKRLPEVAQHKVLCNLQENKELLKIRI